MADVWETTRWWHRHFAESLGMWEVNVYKALVYFHPEYTELKHPEFRRLLAHALLTSGQPLVHDVDKEPPPPTPSRVLEEGHSWTSFKLRRRALGQEVKNEQHTCGYCNNAAYGFCAACFPVGCTPTHAICGPSARGGNNCMQRHSNGEAPCRGMHKRTIKQEPTTSGDSGEPQPKRKARM